MTAVATEALAAERIAREAEGIFDPTPEQVAMLARRRELLAAKKAAEAEIQAIENTVERDMRTSGKRAIAVDGVNLALIVPVTKTVTEVNEPAIKRLHPVEFEAHVRYVNEIAPNFTTITKVPNGDRVNFR